MFSYMNKYDRKAMKKIGFKYNKQHNCFDDKYDKVDGCYYICNIRKRHFNDVEKYFRELEYGIGTGRPAIYGNNDSSDEIIGIYFSCCYSYFCLVKNSEDAKEKIILLSSYNEKFLNENILNQEILNENMDHLLNSIYKFFNLEELYQLINNLKSYLYGFNNVINNESIKYSIDYLSNCLYYLVCEELDKKVDKIKVNELVNEARGLANELSYTREIKLSGINYVFDNADKIIEFVNNVKDECNTSEIRGILNGLKDNDSNYIVGAEFISISLQDKLKEKTIMEYFNKDKNKVKVKE